MKKSPVSSGHSKEGLYQPSQHLITTNMPQGGQANVLSNVQSVLQLTTQVNPPGLISQQSSSTILTSGNVTYSKEPSASSAPVGLTTVQYQYTSVPLSSKNTPVHTLPTSAPLHLRHKVHTGSPVMSSTPNSTSLPGVVSAGPAGSSAHSQNFQRLKVEDALSYLDQVKFKFGNQPQVYNDFLDIMKEFKSQSIDTPGVIQRVSNLFKGHPELIVGFNTFLPPGYKIEVQSNEQGYAFQVSVSMPSPTASTTSLIQTSHHQITPSSGGPCETITLISATSSKHNSHSTTPLAAGTSAASAATAADTALGAHMILSQQPQPQQQQPHVPMPHSLDSTHLTPQSQPVEFNHAINYVNKIKNRFQGQPDKYKRFLEILHTYQKEQRNIKEGTSGGGGKHLTEAEVYSQVSKLFEHQQDLLAEFGQFLPDATSNLNTKTLVSNEHKRSTSAGLKSSSSTPGGGTASGGTHDPSSDHQQRFVTSSSGSGKQSSLSHLKRSSSFSSTGLAKKPKMASLKDVTLAEASKYGSLADFAMFDKIKKSLKNNDVYDNFLRCLNLYNKQLVSKIDLVQVVSPFLSRSPELFNQFKDFVGYTDTSNNSQGTTDIVDMVQTNLRQGEPTTEIDYSSCKRLGASYCALPKSYIHPKCTGRTALCKEVLNDTWVSFPSWSEDTTFDTSKKTQYEEYIYRCEDERFELDVVIEVNGATLRVLEAVQKKMSRMSAEEAQKFRLDDTLGGTSPTIHLLALKRVYGDKAPDMLDGLKKNPLVAIPVVLRRLRAKEEEWRDAQKGFNKIWREQNDKYYLKSLDHQGINFKQTDVKTLRSKNLFNEIEAILDERHEQGEENADVGPHMVLQYKDKTILDDAAKLLLHHVKRLTGVQKEEKGKMKMIVRQFVSDLFYHPRQEMSDDEQDGGDDVKEEVEADNNTVSGDNKPAADDNDDKTKTDDVSAKNEPIEVKKEVEEKHRQPLMSYCPDEYYTLFMGNNSWYLFLRLHQMLCDRLCKIYHRANVLALDEAKQKQGRSQSASLALKLKPKVFLPEDVEVEDYYPAFLDMVKSVLDGNMDSNTYEDGLREMFGIYAYVAFTLDKVVTYAVRQLQNIVMDNAPQECMTMYRQEQKNGGAGGPCFNSHQRTYQELTYQKKFEQTLSDEACFKIFIFKIDCKITFELLDTESEEAEPPAVEPAKWLNYVDKYTTSSRNNPTEEEQEIGINDLPRPEKPVFLPRNVRSWRKVEAARANAPNKSEVAAGGASSVDDNLEERPPPVRMGTDDANSNVVAVDNTECKFNPNSFKILFVINKENLLYRRNCIARAKETHPTLTKKKNKKFRSWNKKWLNKNANDQDVKQCQEWLIGKSNDLVPNKTRIVTGNDIKRPPYMPYNRYQVEYLD